MPGTIATIERKRDGEELTDAEIADLIAGYVRGDVAEYQMAAFAMAVCCRGMSVAETSALTAAMLASGSVLSPIGETLRVDKHSTGGLGDKISLILAPLLACFELHVPMLSGRGLGITGGTLDKLEAIPGYRTDLSADEIDRQLEAVGCVITGTTPDIVPADRKLYALRDVTGTVPSIPLITASIMSKKLAESLDALVLDVKFGSGAFMRERALAEQLADSLVETGERFGVKTVAQLNDMNFPTGVAVGNANEVAEAVAVLRGGGPSDVRELSIRLAADLLMVTGRAAERTTAEESAAVQLDNGNAYERFEIMVAAQGGRLVDLPALASAVPLVADRSGVLRRVDCYRLGMAVVAAGGGRRQVGDTIDPRVGLMMRVRPDELVTAGQPLCELLCDDPGRLEQMRGWLQDAFEIT